MSSGPNYPQIEYSYFNLNEIVAFKRVHSIILKDASKNFGVFVRYYLQSEVKRQLLSVIKALSVNTKQSL
jgi:hypothetical protein